MDIMCVFSVNKYFLLFKFPFIAKHQLSSLILDLNSASSKGFEYPAYDVVDNITNQNRSDTCS